MSNQFNKSLNIKGNEVLKVLLNKNFRKEIE